MYGSSAVRAYGRGGRTIADWVVAMLGSSVMMRQRRRFRAVARVSILSDPAQATKCRVTAAVCVDATFTACRPSTTEHGSVRSRGRALAVDGLEQRAMDLVDRA